MNEVRPAVVAHGGAGGPKEHSDACETACVAALDILNNGGAALDGAVEATVVLEDDPRLNAGTGSNLRLDGITIEMDAAVMNHDRKFGGVAAIRRVQNPVRVARMVLDTPHLLLAGEGALNFAHARGVSDYDPTAARSRERYERIRQFLTGAGAEDPFVVSWKNRDPRDLWNFPKSILDSLREVAGPSDTVGAVMRDGQGRCAAALSTGGTSIMLLGRVGDTPIIGCGLYAGPAGAVAATGDGEEIMRWVLAKTIYDWMEGGVGAQEAVERGLALIPKDFTVGIIAVSQFDEGVVDNRTMPSAVQYLDT